MNTENKPEREKLLLDREVAQNILWDDSDDFDIVLDEVTGLGRWTVNHQIVIRRKSDNKYFRDFYSIGSTESQDERPWQYDAPNFEEVFSREKKVTVYE